MDVASAVSSSKCKQVGSGKIVGGAKGDLGLLGEGDKRPSSVSSPPSPHPAWFTKIMDEPQNRGKLTHDTLWRFLHEVAYAGCGRSRGDADSSSHVTSLSVVAPRARPVNQDHTPPIASGGRMACTPHMPALTSWVTCRSTARLASASAS